MMDNDNSLNKRPTFKRALRNISMTSIFITMMLIWLKWFTEFGHLNRGDMLTSEQHRCHNEKKKFQRRV